MAMRVVTGLIYAYGMVLKSRGTAEELDVYGRPLSKACLWGTTIICCMAVLGIYIVRFRTVT